MQIVKDNAKTVAQQNTAGRLLDTAERLFGKHGYDGVGMRALALKAKANLGAATYHFGSKKALYIETFMRRFRSNNEERLRLLREAELRTNGSPLSVEEIVHCLVRPTYMMGLLHPNFHALLVRSLLTPPRFLDAVLHREFEPNTAVFVAALQRSLPAVSKDVIRMRVAFSMGSLLMFCVQMDKLRTTPHLAFEEGVLKELVRFISTGLQSEPAVPDSERVAFPYQTKLRRER